MYGCEDYSVEDAECGYPYCTHNSLQTITYDNGPGTQGIQYEILTCSGAQPQCKTSSQVPVAVQNPECDGGGGGGGGQCTCDDWSCGDPECGEVRRRWAGKGRGLSASGEYYWTGLVYDKLLPFSFGTEKTEH
jgi:hypothetical protein